MKNFSGAIVIFLASSTMANASDYGYINALSKNLAVCAEIVELTPENIFDEDTCNRASDYIGQAGGDNFIGAMYMYGQHKDDPSGRDSFTKSVWPELEITWASMKRIAVIDSNQNGNESSWVKYGKLGAKIIDSGASSAKPASIANNLVSDIQSTLNSQGYDAGPVDGVMGGRTRSAIEEFQLDRGLPVDGVPSAALLDALQR